jgi:solute:Na+ symporter, SSS family
MSLASSPDIIVIIVYLIAVLAIGIWQAKSTKTGEQFFLAGHSISWPMVGAALFASNVSAEHYVAFAGGAYQSGFVVGGPEFIAGFNLIILAVLFLPFYMRLAVYTTPEFLERRFNLAVRYLMSVNLIVTNILTRLSVSLWAAALVMREFLGWEPMTIVWVIGSLTIVYTLIGGLKGVMYTEAVQAFVMVFSGILLTCLSLKAVGGPTGLVESLKQMGHEGHLHWAKPIDDPNLPWTAYTLPWLVIASFYWCMDQTIVQRALGARSLDDARRGAMFAGYVKLIHMFILLVPGLAALVLYPTLANADEAYPKMINTVMPIGFRGLALAAILAALMSTFASALNSTSTLIVYDFVERLRPRTTEKAKVAIGRVTILLFGLFGIFWAPYIDRLDESLWAYLMRVSLYIQAPIAGVFFIGLLWSGATAAGAVVGICCGMLLGAVSLLIDFNQISIPGFLAPALDHWTLRSYPHRAFLVVLVSAAALIAVSLIQKGLRGGAAPNRMSAEATSIDWKNPRMFESDAMHWWSDWRVWMVGLLVFDVSLYVWLM